MHLPSEAVKTAHPRVETTLSPFPALHWPTQDHGLDEPPDVPLGVLVEAYRQWAVWRFVRRELLDEFLTGLRVNRGGQAEAWWPQAHRGSRSTREPDSEGVGAPIFLTSSGR